MPVRLGLRKLFQESLYKPFAVAELPSLYGSFMILGFANNKDHRDHIAVVKGDVYGKKNVLTRSSSCDPMA